MALPQPISMGGIPSAGLTYAPVQPPATQGWPLPRLTNVESPGGRTWSHLAGLATLLG
jgi:hypothetical protein